MLEKRRRGKRTRKRAAEDAQDAAEHAGRRGEEDVMAEKKRAGGPERTT